MKILNQLLMQQAASSYFHLSPGQPRNICMSTIVIVLGLGIASPAALGHPVSTDQLDQQYFSADLQNEQTIGRPSVRIADISNISLGSDNFNPGLQLPPPKTEFLPPPPQPIPPKPVIPAPEVQNPGRGQAQPEAAKPNPTETDTAIFTPGRARSSGTGGFSSAPVSENPVVSKPEPPKTEPIKPETPWQQQQATQPESSWQQQPTKPEPPRQQQPTKPAPSWQQQPTQPVPSLQKPGVAKGSVIILESVVPDFRSTENESGQVNQYAETTVNFLLENGDHIKIMAGLDVFFKPKFATIYNTPVNISWETKIDSVKIEPSVGVDIFDRLQSVPYYGLKISAPVASNLTLSAAVDYGAYKFNSESIQSQVTALRFGPGLFWQIDKNTSFLFNYKYGIYNDSNAESQIFSRLEYKSGQFWAAGNLFTWGYQQNIGAAKGYFSPSNFIAYSAEVGVEGEVFFDGLKCKLSTQFGNQSNDGNATIGNSYQAACKAKISPSLDASFGYGFGNSRKDYSSGETGRTITINGGLVYRF